MLRRIRPNLSFANVVSVIALFVALGGVGYAAIKLPANSVGSPQIVNGAITGADVKNGSLTGADIKNSSLTSADTCESKDVKQCPQNGKGGTPVPGPAGAQGGVGPAGTPGTPGAPGKDGSDATLSGVPAGGDLTGTYPTPTLAPSSVDSGAIAPGAVTPAQIGVLPAARAYQSAVYVGIPNNTTTTAEFGSEAFDTGSLHSIALADRSRLTAPIDGVYVISGQVSFQANATGVREATVFKNGNDSSILVNEIVGASPSFATDLPLTTIARLNAGDFVELSAYQNSGIELLFNYDRTHLAMAWIAP